MFPNLRTFSKQNKNPTKNQIIIMATTTKGKTIHVLFLEDDSTPTPQLLFKLLEHLRDKELPLFVPHGKEKLVENINTTLMGLNIIPRSIYHESRLLVRPKSTPPNYYAELIKDAINNTTNHALVITYKANEPYFANFTISKIEAGSAVPVSN